MRSAIAGDERIADLDVTRTIRMQFRLASLGAFFHRLALGLSLGLLPRATTPAQAPAPSWRFVATPYLWTAGLDGQVGFKNVVADVDLSFSDILRNLRFAAMARAEARNGPIVLGVDAIYVSLGDSKAFAIRGASGEIKLNQRETIVQPMVGYGFTGDGWAVDALVGARYWNLSTEFILDPARLATRSRSGTVDWLDATGGVRANFTPWTKVHLIAEGDAGGGGSRNTWQAAGTASYDVAKHYTVIAGYRYLAVDYDHDGFLFDTHMSGLVLGVNIRIGPN
jgi:hypothetical protein